jgi:hypothetical protein
MPCWVLPDSRAYLLPNKWDDGLFSLWELRQPEGLSLLGPDGPAGEPPCAVGGSDDPRNGKPLLVARID